MKYIILILVLAAMHAKSQVVPTSLLLSIYENHYDDTAKNNKILTSIGMYQLYDGKDPQYHVQYIGNADSCADYLTDGVEFYTVFQEKAISYNTDHKKVWDKWESDLFAQGFKRGGSVKDDTSFSTFYRKAPLVVLVQKVIVGKQLLYKMCITTIR
jgi:hypothetical protein